MVGTRATGARSACRSRRMSVLLLTSSTRDLSLDLLGLVLPKGAVRQLRMRHDEAWLINMPITEADDVEIQRARAPADVTDAPVDPLDLVQAIEQHGGFERRPQRDHLIEVPGLVRR